MTGLTVDLESVCFLPHSAGAVDGTCMEIKKPTVYEGVCVCKCWPSWISK
jgi:hypothetical protein